VKRVRLSFLLAGLVLLVGAAPVFAQIDSMSVHIPFNFLVGQKAYSAGDYLVTSANLTTYRLIARDGGPSAAVVTQSVDSGLQRHEAGLVFANLGAGQYALTQIWVHGGNWGSSLPPSRSLRMIGQGPTVEVAAKH
jgi:hypothetical protein